MPLPFFKISKNYLKKILASAHKNYAIDVFQILPLSSFLLYFMNFLAKKIFSLTKFFFNLFYIAHFKIVIFYIFYLFSYSMKTSYVNKISKYTMKKTDKKANEY